MSSCGVTITPAVSTYNPLDEGFISIRLLRTHSTLLAGITRLNMFFIFTSTLCKFVNKAPEKTLLDRPNSYQYSSLELMQGLSASYGFPLLSTSETYFGATCFDGLHSAAISTSQIHLFSPGGRSIPHTDPFQERQQTFLLFRTKFQKNPQPIPQDLTIWPSPKVEFNQTAGSA